MRMLAGAVAAAALIGTTSLAYAATDAGKITDINQPMHSITLNTGSRFMVPDRTELSNLRVGENVNVAYAGRGSMKQAASINPTAQSYSNLGGL